MNKDHYLNPTAADNGPEVLYQLQRLSDAVESANSRTELLTERLAFVLGPAYPSPKTGETSALAPPESSPLAQNIRSLVARVERIEATINQTLSRLEVG